MESVKTEVTLFEVKVKDESHTILRTPTTLPAVDGANPDIASAFNLVMIDVSGSMWCYWNSIMKHWNESLSTLLKECTRIYVFGSEVHFLREGTVLEESDFLSESTNLTEAIKSINNDINSCKETFIRLFLVTDGHHNATEITPDVEIAKLCVPSGKTVEVFLLGLGFGFPVEYSITIRSALHNGNSNVPSLFWGKCENEESTDSDIREQIESMVEIVQKGNVKLKLCPKGFQAPGFEEIDSAYLGEYVYYPMELKDVNLKIMTEYDVELDLEVKAEAIGLRYLLDKVFRQWNSIIIQVHRKTKKVPETAFEVMESIYANLYSNLEEDLEREVSNKQSIKYRLLKKDLKFLETEFRTLMNQSKNIISLEGKFSSEIELAENILKTTVKSKYDMKNLKMRGHSAENYEEDMTEFINTYDKIKDNIMLIPEPSADDCCRVTMGSLIKDLQDPSLRELLEEDKFTFLKTFTVTGVPIYAPVKDSSQINPWSMCIQNILSSPFTIISQCVLELSADVGKLSSTSENKDVYLQEDDERTRFNAVVPVFSQQEVAVLKPLLYTNIFAMLSTFCILKNPHVIDHYVHLAALSCIWMKDISDYSEESRPQFVVERLEKVEETAKVYLTRKSISKYLEVLLTDSKEAIMTESVKTYDEKTLKCESLIKPMFLLYLIRKKNEVGQNLINITRFLITEFIGRCLAHFVAGNQGENIYCKLFAPELSTKDKRQEWCSRKVAEVSARILESFKDERGALINAFFIPEDLLSALKSHCNQEFKKLRTSTSFFAIELNVKLLEKLSNLTSCGNIKINALKAFLREMKTDESVINELFEKEKLMAYVHHGLKLKASKERLQNDVEPWDEALKYVKIVVSKEIMKLLKVNVMKKILDEAESEWMKDYYAIHEEELALPLTQDEILQLATAKGVQVNEDNFSKIYKFSKTSKLLRNACMIPKCPFYLVPNRTFNQHVHVERRHMNNNYAHQLHKITREVARSSGETKEVMKNILEKGYSSQNMLRIPPTPSKESIHKMEKRIFDLIIQYREKDI